MELVTPMMEMILTTSTLMLEMMVVVMVVTMVETEKMMEVTMRMTTMPHYLLRGG